MRLAIDIVVERQRQKINLLTPAFEASRDHLAVDVVMICQSDTIFRHTSSNNYLNNKSTIWLYLTTSSPVDI
jgi:hypothetical protein